MPIVSAVVNAMVEVDDLRALSKERLKPGYCRMKIPLHLEPQAGAENRTV